jgi:uncharacterized protein with ParB-like and HNH nuclease domain
MNQTFKIDADPQSLNKLLTDRKYSIDFYQREYRWQTKQIEELLSDLTDRFMSFYDPTHDRQNDGPKYPHYFLGSIILSRKNGQDYIIDGQQRLTSMTLLLIFLNNLQNEIFGCEEINLRKLIFSDVRGGKSYNLQIEDRVAVMDALFGQQPFDANGDNESVQNIVGRYEDIESMYFDDLRQPHALLLFIDWLIYNVDLVEIVAYSDEEAYTVFETMNDRGLSLNPTDMLKGYLLSRIKNDDERANANGLWKDRMTELVELGRKLDTKSEEVEACKAWLRAKYASSIREHKRGAENQDFEIIGTAFHRWVGDADNQKRIGLSTSEDFRNFIAQNFERYTRWYKMLREAGNQFTPELEYVYYNNFCGFTLQYLLELAPLQLNDTADVVMRKIRLVSGFIDIYIARRMVNYRTLSYSSIVYTMFRLMVEIRDKSVAELAAILKQKVAEFDDPNSDQYAPFSGILEFAMRQQNRWRVHYLLARMTHHIECESGVAAPADFLKYVNKSGEKRVKPFQVEHIWANRPERHTDEFVSPNDFGQYRNRIGGLLLLPRGFNQSYGDLPYADKLHHYYGQNLLARSLSPQCYERNPNFTNYLTGSGLPFQAHEQFKKADLDARQDLYRQICEEIWNSERFDRELL